MNAQAATLSTVDLDFLGPKRQGKVRDIYTCRNQLVLITTDRLSAFDRILGLIPFKGQVLNQVSAYWFETLADIVPNHTILVPDPNVTIAQICTPVPVEVVVRGYITGVTDTSLWYRYSLGERNIYGLDFPDGLEKNDPLPQPVITPTTKATDGGHDQRITSEEIVASGLVAANLWQEICEKARALFLRGQKIAQRAGLILVDTKYEFGLSKEGRLTLMDEVHTPDSSRFWLAGSYPRRIAAGEEPENYDKEFIRLYYAAKGYTGEGDPPALTNELATRASERYREVFEMLTGRTFQPGQLPADERIRENLRQLLT